MKASKLIKKINSLQKAIEDVFQDEVKNIIDSSLNGGVLKESKDCKKIKSISDLEGWDTNGFYMIFNNHIVQQNTCTCQVKLDGENKPYICVYRGHSYHLKDRIQSHLFYDFSTSYNSCMQVLVKEKKYNIDISKGTLYFKGEPQKNLEFPRCNWLVVKITLSNSKQSTREMFESVFDSVYGKPIYSDK